MRRVRHPVARHGGVALSLLVAAAAPAPAGATDLIDILERGSWGYVGAPEITCETNPHRLDFAPDRRAMTVRYTLPFRARDGSLSSAFRYRVLAIRDYEVVMRWDGEYQRGHDGALITWTIRLHASGYTWHPSDPAVVPHRVVRCGGG